MNLASLLASGGQSLNVPLVLLLIKATTILLAALGITLAMQRASAGARHLVWLVTLGALLLIPALTAWGPLRLEILPATESASVPAVPAIPAVPTTPQAVITNGSASIAATGSPLAASEATAVPSSASSPSASSGVIASIRDASLWVVALTLWAIVALAIVVSLTWSALVVRRLVRRSESLDDQSWLTPLYEVSDRLGLDEPPRLLMSRDAKMPFACGLATPTIVLPAECENWSHERRLAVLLHELAHVRRRDLLGHTLGRLVCAVYWFHPLAWTAARQLRAESERACDDLALSCGTRATDYAEHLLDIVTSVRRESTPMVALAMARRKEFEGRMLAILDPELRHSTPSRRQSATLIGTLALLSIVVGAAVPAPASAKPAAAQNVATHEADVEHVVATHAPEVVNDSNVANDRVREQPLAACAGAGAGACVQLDADAYEPVDHPADEHEHESLAARAAGGARVENAVTSAVGVVVEQVVPNALQMGANAARVSLQELIRQAPQGKQAADERPALLARVLRSDSSASLRRVAAWGLNEYGEDPVAVEALVNAVRRDASEDVREMAAWSLSDSDRSPGAIDALAAALRDASVNVRKSAAWALGNIGDRPRRGAARRRARGRERRRALARRVGARQRGAEGGAASARRDVERQGRTRARAHRVGAVQHPGSVVRAGAAGGAEDGAGQGSPDRLHPRARGDGREVRRRDPAAARVERPSGSRRWRCARSPVVTPPARGRIPGRSPARTPEVSPHRARMSR